ncbi:MAG TPA: hypothetical protein PK668_08870 [Myxococcota bacterium]|nr:hypothetical protein [Myxococcota bacterium]HRY92909.1 hypothetical protein [Myxococcota bacterium]HSA20902.1 hypothetical protein [Myxococcota bacterium]
MSGAERSRGKVKTRAERLRAAAVVKLKYCMLSGKIDKGFQTIFDGVLRDFGLEEAEVDRYLDEHREELVRICVEEG